MDEKIPVPIIPTLYEMEVCIAKYFNPRVNTIVPNISWGIQMHECDILVVTPAGMCTEIEIKRSRADLLHDFKKHHGHKDRRIGKMYYAIPESLYEKCKDLIPEDSGILVIWKHPKGWVCSSRKEANSKRARKLTEKEILKVARLGTMRIWNLKSTIIKLTKKKPA